LPASDLLMPIDPNEEAAVVVVASKVIIGEEAMRSLMSGGRGSKVE
jgi:hypothetical protein